MAVCDKVASDNVPGSENVPANMRTVEGSDEPRDSSSEGSQFLSACTAAYRSDQRGGKLNYVDVCVMGIEAPIKSLVDTGSQINCVHPKACDALNLTPVWRIFTKGIFARRLQRFCINFRLH